MSKIDNLVILGDKGEKKESRRGTTEVLNRTGSIGRREAVYEGKDPTSEAAGQVTHQALDSSKRAHGKNRIPGKKRQRDKE